MPCQLLAFRSPRIAVLPGWSRLPRMLLVLLIFWGLAQVGAADTSPIPYRALYAFGDSYSDIGARYIDGNGPTAVAYLAQRMGIDITYPQDPQAAHKSLDFAASGAPTGREPQPIEVRPGISWCCQGLLDQVDDFLARVHAGSVSFNPETTLFFLAGGLNDVKLTTEQSVNNLRHAIELLRTAGARHIVVALVPAKAAGRESIASRLNPAYQRLVLEMRTHADLDLRLSHWGEYYDEILDHPSQYGIVNTTSRCAGRALFKEDPTPCASPQTYFYYHEGHPSTAVHRIVGDRLYEEIQRVASEPKSQAALDAPALRIAILGNPVQQVSWSGAALEKLKDLGFNEVQLNIGWGARPFDEPLNLADVVSVPGEPEMIGTAARRAELHRRVALAKAHRLRTLFLFGSPHMDHNPYFANSERLPQRIDDVTFDSWYDIVNPRVRNHELALLQQFRREFPDVEDILIYNYDNDAWETPEFQYNKFSYGVPLSDRLPGYLQALHKVWTEGRAGQVRLWWEPWELSAGEVYAMLPKLPRVDFGLIIHANIAEAQLAQPVDVWFRNTARMCRDLGLPLVAESFFGSTTEEIEPLSIPAPRLVDEEYQAFARVPGVVGIKEYYGINTEVPDLDLELLQARVGGAHLATDDLIAQITQRFGPAQSDVREYLDHIADALQTYPWDASWFAREVGKASLDHGWSAATVRGASWPTPSWESTRHARFMKTDSAQPHFWMLEDVQLRCKLSADLFDAAYQLGSRLLQELANEEDRNQFLNIQKNIDIFRHVARSYALHLRETNIAQMLRQDLSAGRPLTAALVKELSQALDQDVSNQGGHGRVLEMRRLYQESPQEFLRLYLLPVEGAPAEKGDFTLTTR